MTEILLGDAPLCPMFRVCLSWSMLGHVLSKEQSKVGSDGVSDDGRLTIVQCHHYHQPPLLDLYRSSVGILPLLQYHQPNLHSYHCPYQPAPCAIYRSTTTAPPCSTHVPCSRPITSRTHQFSRSWVTVTTRTCEDLHRHPSAPPEYESPCYMFILLPYAFTITPYMFMFCFSINTPVCCMYFASSNISLATYFSLTPSRLLKLLLGLTPDSPCYDFILYTYDFIFIFTNLLNNMPWTHVHLFLLSSMHNAHVTC